MKKSHFFLNFVMILLTSVMADATESKLSYNKRPLQVVASFTILKNFIEEVGGPHVNVQSVVQANEDPHVYEPTPQTATQILAADLVFFNGLGFETWMSRLVEASGYKGPLIVASQGIAPRILYDPGIESAEDVVDPHAWNQVSNAKIYVRNIEKALIQHDPEHSKAYKENAQAYLKKLEALDAWIQETLCCIPEAQREIITAHDAFGYYGAAYRIKVLSPVGISTEAEASAWDVAKLVDQIGTLKINVIFVENISNTKVMQQLSEETGAQIGGTLYSDSLSLPSGPAPTYEAMMRHNTTLIAQAMKQNDPS